MATTQELLDATNDAILKVLGGAQEYQNPVDGSTVRYASLEQLRATKRELEATLQNETGGMYREVGFGRAGGCT